MKRGFVVKALGIALAVSMAVPQSVAYAQEEIGIIEETVDESFVDSDQESVEESLVEEASEEDSAIDDEIVIEEDNAAAEASDEVSDETSDDEVFQEEPMAEVQAVSGKLGNISWSLDNSGTFILDGSGVMSDGDYYKYPWDNYRKSIKKVVVKGTITSIGAWAFKDCTNLKEVVFETKVLTNIKSDAFYNTGISKINLPESLTTIGSMAFRYSKLTSITLPSELTTMGNTAFGSSTGLSEVIIKSNRLTDVGIGCFEYCAIKKVSFPDDMTTVPAHIFWDASFAGCTVTIPRTVRTIGTYAFEVSTAPQYGTLNIVFEEGSQLSTIGDFAFWCANLYKIDLPESTSNIGHGAFARTHLSTITLPSGLQTLQTDAFQGCSQLAEVILKSQKLSNVGYSVFSNCAIRKVVFPEGIKTIPANLFYSANFDSCTITIPKTVTSIGNYAFYADVLYGNGLKGIKFEEGSQLQVIGACAFVYCRLYELKLPSSLRTIGNYAFAKCYIDELEIPSGVTNVGYCAFEDCPNLYRISLPASIKEIGYSAFTTTDGKVIKCRVVSGSYAYEYVKKYASKYNYVIVQFSPISYVLNGGTNNSKNPSGYDNGDSIYLYDPERAGYAFKGWFLDSKFTKSWKEADTSKGGKLTFYAKWEANTYKVTLNANGKGASLKGTTSFDAVYGKAYPKLDVTATRTGYKFAGWYTESTGGTKVTPGKTAFDLKNPKAAVLYAHWTPVKYKITYQLDGGKLSGKAPKNYTEDKECQLPTPTRKGFSFVRWDVTDHKGKVTVSGGKLSGGSGNYGDITLKAVWQESSYKIVIHKNMPGATQDKTVTKTFNYSSEVVIFALAYAFDDFQPQYGSQGELNVVSLNTRANGKGKKYDMSKSYTKLSDGGSIDLYLQWGKVTYYRIGYQLEGGTLKNPVNAYTGASNVKLPKPTKPGYKFTGWKANYVSDSVKVTSKGVNTTINKGSKGDIYFTATYAPLK